LQLKNVDLVKDVLFDELGLESVDLGPLDWGERGELRAALSDAGVQLGDRLKLRLWMDEKAERSVHHPETRTGADLVRPVADARLLSTDRTPRRHLQSDKGGADGGLSTDVAAALVFTAGLGVLTFLGQARVAKNAEATQRDIERAQTDHDKARALASVQLERVRSQMADVYMPVGAYFLEAWWREAFLARELGFDKVWH
jgi:hypothetical protein